VLGLDAEEEAGGEVEDVDDARRPVGLLLVVGQVVGLEVAVAEGDQPPDDREAQPREHEAEREHEQRPPPLHVHQRGEDVLQIAQPPLRDVCLHHVALAVLEHHPLARLAAPAPVPHPNNQNTTI
jgi:hypothetical protein